MPEAVDTTSGSSTRGRVLITGSAGALGSLAFDGLAAAGFATRGMDVVPPTRPQPDFLLGSVSSPERMAEACSGVDGVLHLAGASTPEASWEECLAANVVGTRTVLEAARVSGVRRVVVASSNHAVGFTRRGAGVLPADVPARPDSFYGVSKVAMEALASYYADEFGMRTLSLRIGSCFPRPTSSRMLATWLSPDDLVRLAVAAMTAEWTGHRVVWGISRNTRRWWSLDEAAAIGFLPEDDAEVYADDVEPAEEAFVGGRAPGVRAASRG
ncbi:NAD-dependent epimerase/dehydratase family protein [Amnibacterium sp.]|uniref:NAD-dependent epimerase/dehydratase family protein n=1 Tax=Amnibacterium sp. TaxID=1872496 RepID=UPI003F7BF352